MVQADVIPHGTKLMELKPSSVVGAAEADIRRFWRNAEIKRGRKPYAFHRKHVRKAARAGDGPGGILLLRLALADLEAGADSGKETTRMLYGAPQLLEQALELAGREDQP
jgi:hypothetical protein